MLETSLLIATIATLGMVSPGPDFFLIVKNAARYSRRTALSTVAGILAGIATHMAYCVAGLAVVIQTTPWLFSALKYAGAAYLIWIGIQALRTSGGENITETGAGEQTIPWRQAFVQGYLCNLLNPKATLFFLAMFTQVLSVTSTTGEKIWYAFIIWFLAVLWWPLLVFLIQSAPVRRMLSRAQRIVDKILGGVLVGLGCKVALS